MLKLRLSPLSMSFLTIVTIAALPSAAAADCVRDLSRCASRCDQQYKPGDPLRPSCARGCATRYPTCERRALEVNPVAPPPAKKP